MTMSEYLEQYAYDHDITIVQAALECGTALAARHRSRRLIIIDPARLQTEAERAYALAHEIAHHEHDTLNSRFTRYTPPGKMEHQTEAAVIEQHLPKCILDAAIASHDGRMWEVAEEVGLPESIVRRAAKLYRERDET